MMKKSRLFTFLIALFTVTAINVRTVLDTNHSYDLSMTSIEAISGEGDDNENSSGGINGENDGKGDEDISGENKPLDPKCDTDGSGTCYKIGRAHV